VDAVVIVAAMSRPMPQGDPVRLGPFRLMGRLVENSAGISYLGVDPEGRRVSVAVLTRGAAGDAAARDRFRAAIVAARADGPLDGGRPRTGSGAADRRRAGSSEVVAAEPDGLTPWVATVYEEDRPGAERFLEAVLLTGTFESPRAAGGRSRPRFQPYWTGSREPAVGGGDDGRPAEGLAGGTEAGTAERGAAVTAVTVVAVLALVLLLASLLYACQPVRMPEPVPTDLPSRPVEPFTPPPSPTPVPTRTGTGSPSGGQV
jgi:hypothetical protein